MGAAKHTPGPWQRSGIRQKLGDEDCLRVGPDGIAIAFLPIGRRPNEQAGAIADATLIAAAPDLLAACELFAAYQEAVESDDPEARPLEKYSLAMDAARAAIAKARGEA